MFFLSFPRGLGLGGRLVSTAWFSGPKLRDLYMNRSRAYALMVCDAMIEPKTCNLRLKGVNTALIWRSLKLLLICRNNAHRLKLHEFLLCFLFPQDIDCVVQ